MFFSFGNQGANSNYSQKGNVAALVFLGAIFLFSNIFKILTLCFSTNSKRKVIESDSDSEFEVEKKKPKVSSEDLFDSMMSGGNESEDSPVKKGKDLELN